MIPQHCDPRRFMKKMLRLGICFSILAATRIATVQGASVGPSGYTNDFSTQPAAADWSFYSIAGAATDVITASALDTAVQAVAAGTISNPIGSDPGNPPPFFASALWSSTGLYVQTRPPT